MSDALNAGVAALRQRFIDRTIAQRPRFAALRAMLTEGKLQGAELEELRQLCHKLHGAGGTFGLPEFSAVAGQAEDWCDAMVEQPEEAGIAPRELGQVLDTLVAMIAKLG